MQPIPPIRNGNRTVAFAAVAANRPGLDIRTHSRARETGGERQRDMCSRLLEVALDMVHCASPSIYDALPVAGDIYIPVSIWSWVVECIGSRHVLWIMWMAHPNQASRPQGYHHVNGDTLAANDSGIGSGWQQSKQN